MKFLKYFFGANVLFFSALLSFSVHFTSCVKETVHDTITVTNTDTVIVTHTDTTCHLDLGMIAHYSFTNGSLLDESGHNNDIIFNSAIATPDRWGTPGNAYLFDGSASYMRVANSPSLNPLHAISMVAIVKPNDFYRGTCHFSELLGKGIPDPVQGLYILRIADPWDNCYGAADTTKEYFIGGYGDNIPEGSTAGLRADTSYIHAGNWYTVVYTYDGHESRLYVNGQLKKLQLNTVPFTPNENDVFIGKHDDPAFPYYFNGVMDELRIYDRALCSCEVTELSNPENAAP